MAEPASPPTLTYGLRQLVWGIESEVAVITNLSRRIDEHVERVNALRTEVVERLLRLDGLTAVADNPDLEAFLRRSATTSLPTVQEHFPERLYGG